MSLGSTMVGPPGVARGSVTDSQVWGAAGSSFVRSVAISDGARGVKSVPDRPEECQDDDDGMSPRTAARRERSPPTRREMAPVKTVRCRPSAARRRRGSFPATVRVWLLALLSALLIVAPELSAGRDLWAAASNAPSTEEYLIMSLPGTRMLSYSRLSIDPTVLRPLVISGLITPKSLALDAENFRLFVADPANLKIFW